MSAIGVSARFFMQTNQSLNLAYKISNALVLVLKNSFSSLFLLLLPRSVCFPLLLCAISPRCRLRLQLFLVPKLACLLELALELDQGFQSTGAFKDADEVEVASRIWRGGRNVSATAPRIVLRRRQGRRPNFLLIIVELEQERALGIIALGVV